MKGFAKIILAVVAGLVAVLLLILVGINLYLQSGSVQQRIRLATERAIGMPVAVKRTLYTPWGGLSLTGLSLPDPTIPGANLVEAPKFSVHFEFLPLLGRRFVISEVSLTGPHLTLRQTEDRRWVLLAPRPPRPEAEKPAAPPATAATEEVPPPAYTVELRHFSIHEGRADIVDRRGQTLARVEGLSVDGRLHDKGRKVEGDVRIEKIELVGQFYPNRLRAHFVHEGERLTVSDVKCAIAGGKVRAQFHAVTPRRGPPDIHLKSEIEDVSIPTLIAEARGNERGTAGTLLGTFELKGNPLAAKSLTGRGELSLDSAQLRPLDFIQQIGAIFRLDELQMLDLQQALVRFEIRDERVWMNELLLQTDNVIITGKGPIRFDGKLNLAGRLLLNEKIQRQLGGLLGDNFTASENAGYRQVGFSVTGRLDRPKTDLVEKITGIQLGNMGGLIKGLFRLPKAAPPPDESSSAATAAEPTPTPARSN